MIEWHFFEKVYRRWVVFMIGNLDDFRAFLEAQGYKDMDFIIHCKGMCIELRPDNHTTGQSCVVLWLNGYETATLVHEITHLSMMSLDSIGIPLSRDNTESLAFYNEYWFNEIQRARRKYPKGRSPAIAKRSSYV